MDFQGCMGIPPEYVTLSLEDIATARHRTPRAGSLEWSGLLYSWDPPMADLLIEMPITVAAVRREEYRVVLIAIHMLLTSSVYIRGSDI